MEFFELICEILQFLDCPAVFQSLVEVFELLLDIRSCEQRDAEGLRCFHLRCIPRA
jgi:hypothetical protein